MTSRNTIASTVAIALVAFAACSSDPEGPSGQGGTTSVGGGASEGGGGSATGIPSQGGNEGPCNGAQSGTLELCECTCDGVASSEWFKGISRPHVDCSSITGHACAPGDPLPIVDDGTGGAGEGGGSVWTGCEVIDTALDCGP